MNKKQSLSSSSIISNLTETLLGHLGPCAPFIITSTPVSHTVHATNWIRAEALNRAGGDRGSAPPFSARVVVVVAVQGRQSDWIGI